MTSRTEPCLRSPPTTLGQPKYNRCGARRRRRTSILTCGSNNVERVAAARVGQETVRYVRNIYKYYVAYKLIEEADATKKAAVAAAKARSAAAGADTPPAKP